jgi:hypothetical protein
MKIELLSDDHISILEEFCEECNQLGYTNNSSLTAMKFDWCRQQGYYYGAIKNNKIVAVAGCHPLTEISKDAWRILFRGCELPGASPYKGLNKGDWNSITQRDFIPIFIKQCPTKEQKILDFVCDMELYHTMQTVWKLNINEYTRRRNLLCGSIGNT